MIATFGHILLECRYRASTRMLPNISLQADRER
jgi:hypothetical protein